MTDLAAVSTRYYAGRAPTGKDGLRPEDLTETFLAEIRAFREEIRADEGGGGMCHFVTEWLTVEANVERVGVSYLSATGEVCFEGHYVVILADGSLLDPAADQLGEGHDIRLIAPYHPDYGRYRPEFYEDYHPGLAHCSADLAGYAPLWTGELDSDAQCRIETERGRYWWHTDKDQLVGYLNDQIEHATRRGLSWAEHDLGFFRKGLADLQRPSPTANGLTP